MKPDEIQYILYRVKSQSYFQNGIPYEYPATRIRQDMKRAGFSDLPTEVELENFVQWKKDEMAGRIIGMASDGMSMADIRTWCEYSLDCPVPIPSLNQVTAENILARFDYFNFVINKISRQRQMDVLIRHRSEHGTSLDIGGVIRDLENSGLYALQDEITKTSFYSEGDLLRILMEEEENSIKAMNEYIRSGLSEEEIVKICREDNCFIFTDKEIIRLIEESMLKHRLTEISKQIKSMQTGEIWNFINVVDGYQVWRITKDDISTVATKVGIDATTLETLKAYEEETKPRQDDYFYHLSKMKTRELNQLSKMLRAYVSWRSMFHFIRKEFRPSSPQDLMQLIIEGFSGENGIDPVLFRCFLY